MGKIIKLTESDLKKLINGIIKEESKKPSQINEQSVIELINRALSGGGGPRLTVSRLIDGCRGVRPEVNSISTKAADMIYNAISGAGTNEEQVYSALNSLSSYPQFCGCVQTYKSSYNESLWASLDGDFDMDSEWTQIMIPIRNLAMKYRQTVSSVSATPNPKSPEVIKLYASYPCVPNHPKSQVQKTSDGKPVLSIGGVTYYPNGRKFDAQSKVTSNYTCKDPIFGGAGTAKPQTTGPQPQAKPTPTKSIREQLANALANTVRSVAQSSGVAKNTMEIDPKIIQWLRTNKISKGRYSTSLKNNKMIDIKFFPESTLGYSKEKSIAPIYRPSNVTKPSGDWVFDGTKIIFK